MIPREKYKDTAFVNAVANYIRAMVAAGLEPKSVSLKVRNLGKASVEEILQMTKELKSKHSEEA